MTNKELVKLLSQSKNERRGGAPHEAWVKQNREILMMQVRNTMDLRAKTSLGEKMRHLFDIFVPMEALATAGRAFAVFALVIGTVFGGGLVSAGAFRASGPGDSLYKMKLAVESVQLLLAPNEEYRTRLHTEFADRRLDEIAKLAEGTSSDHGEAVKVLALFSTQVEALKSGLERLRSEDPAGVSESAKLLERKMAVYQSVLAKAGASLPPSAKHEVARTMDVLDSVAISAMAVIVENHLAGDVRTPQNLLVNKFEDHLKQAQAKLDSAVARDGEHVLPKAGEANAAIARAKEQLKQQNYQAALTTMTEVAELTKEIEAVIDAAETAPAETAPADETKTDVPASNTDSQQPQTNSQPANQPVPTGSTETPSADAAGSGNR